MEKPAKKKQPELKYLNISPPKDARKPTNSEVYSKVI
jgi:hypothetical protein